MSCVIGLVDNGRVWMGGDSIAVDSAGWKVSDNSPKVFRRENYVLGVAGSIRLRQLLRFEALPELRADEPERSVEVLVETIREMAEAKKLLDGAGELPSTGLLVGFAGCLFDVQPNFGVVSPRCGYSAIGVGGPAALGALAILAHSNKGPEERIKQALSASAQFCAMVCPPFVVESL